MATVDHTKMDKFVDGKLVKEGKKETSSIEGKHYWWKAAEGDIAQQVQATIRFISSHQSTRIEQLVVGTRLYGNASAFNFIGPALSRSASSSANAQSNRLSFNLCASVIDTLTSKIAKNKVVPMFLTSGAVWGMQRKAEQMSKFTEGCFYANDVHSKGTYSFRDAGAWGTGILHIFDDEDNIGVERVLPHEILVDEIEAMKSDPRQMHRVNIVDRDTFAAMFEDDEEALQAIKDASITNMVDLGAEGTAADLITVTESWHLPSSKDANDGVRVLCAGDRLVKRYEYKKDYFPFAFIHYNKRLTGFWGQGACERLQNLQGEINREMILIQRSHWMGGSFKVLVENGSKVVSQHLNNDVGAIIHYTGTPPQYVTPPMIQPDVYSWVDSLIAKGYQQEGVSQLAASSLKPMGVDSGKALRAFDNIAEDRFLFTSQEMEKFYLEVARQMIEVAKDIYRRKKTFKVIFPTTKFMETIDWKDIKLEQDEYVMKAFPVSSLTEEPSGKLQEVQEYAAAGYLSPRAARRLLTMPDMEMADKLANAAEDLLHKIFEDMLDEEGEYTPPEPLYDLNLAKQLALEYYNYASLNNCPQDKLALLRRFMNQVDDLLGVSAPAPMPGVVPPANPMPTPTSPLIPNTNAVPAA